MAESNTYTVILKVYVTMTEMEGTAEQSAEIAADVLGDILQREAPHWEPLVTTYTQWPADPATTT